jgi:hypothetical protein
MTYTSRLYDSHRVVIESFVIANAGTSEFKGIKYASMSEAKIKYAMLEKVFEIIAQDLDVESVQQQYREQVQADARKLLDAAAKNHKPAEEMIEEKMNELTDCTEYVTDEIPSYQELEADLVGTL